MEINEASGVSLYRQVAAAVREAIQSGTYRTGNRLPPAEELATQYGVGRVTALRAIADLQAEGFVVTKRGQGTYVRGVPELLRYGVDRYRRRPDGVSPNVEESRAGGWQAEIEAEPSYVATDSDVASRLGIAQASELSVIHYRWMTENDQPIQISTQWEPLSITSGTTIEKPPTSGIPDVITRFDSIGIHVDRVEELARTRMPTVAESAALMIGAGTPVLFIQRTHWAGRTAVETADITIRGDRMAIVTSHIVSTDGVND